MKLNRKIPTTRLTFDRLERGSLIIENCVIDGPVDDVVAVLTELLDGRTDPFKALPTLAPGEPVPDT